MVMSSWIQFKKLHPDSNVDRYHGRINESNLKTPHGKQEQCKDPREADFDSVGGRTLKMGHIQHGTLEGWINIHRD